MRKPRVRLREFLLLVTLASLVTAAFAIRARTAYHLSSEQYALRAHRERLDVRWMEYQMERAEKILETTPPIPENWAAGCELRLIPSVKGLGDMPMEGKNLIVVAKNNDDHFFFRMFDGRGKIVVDWVQGMQTDGFKERFMGLWPPHELTAGEKSRAITAMTSFLGAQRAAVQASLKGMQAERAEAIARAEHLEGLARSAQSSTP